MERGVNSIPGWLLELVGDLVDLPLDRERINIAGTQLLVGQAESQVPSGQPYPVSRVVNGSWGTSSICKALMSPHCPLEVDVS